MATKGGGYAVVYNYYNRLAMEKIGLEFCNNITE